MLNEDSNYGILDVDTTGCLPDQYDDDQDLIDNTADRCEATPAGEQVDANGCAESQKDEDNDDVWNSNDLCYDTPANQAVDLDGCSEYQKDDDDDNYPNALDKCKNTPSGEIVNSDGCSLSQIDSDGDGELMTKTTSNLIEMKLQIAMVMAYQTDGTHIHSTRLSLRQRKRNLEVASSTLLLQFLILAVIGALLFVKNRDPPSGENSPFANASEDLGYADDSSFMMDQGKKYS